MCQTRVFIKPLCGRDGGNASPDPRTVGVLFAGLLSFASPLSFSVLSLAARLEGVLEVFRLCTATNSGVSGIAAKLAGVC